MNDTAGLILAAGEGSRLGRGPKALLPIGPTTLVQRAIRTLQDGGCAPVLVVIGAGADRIEPLCRSAKARPVVNTDWARGLASSFRRGIDALPPQAQQVVITVVDQPGISTPLITKLLEQHRPGRVSASCYDGRHARHPMIFDADLARAAATMAEGDRGARAFLRGHADLVDLIDTSELGSAADIDHPQDLRLLEDP